MEDAGDYQYIGFAYSNVSGFETKNGDNVGSFNINYGLSISDVNLEFEGLFTDKGVGGINKSSAISPDNIAGISFFGSIKPDEKLISDDLFSSGRAIASWSAQTSYTATIYDKRLIPYINYSQIIQDGDNNSIQFGTGARYNLMYGSWLGLDYTSISTNSKNYTQKQNYLSVNYTIYL